ncbi:hypothetical protein [Streptomyces sp. DSM 40907]|uniref:hypothetical protein n=1 Tax=Streptomyces kutzneri TaxID=3051179 RepID=UPI0028D43FA2|nr:hypothetical protein [Streptomyces sp. DSM 40907]
MMMVTFGARDVLFGTAVLVALLLALLAAVVAGVLARSDGATVPAAVSRAGVAIATTLGVAASLLALFRR